VVSPCGRYRYRLDREDFSLHAMGFGLNFGFFGVNPSTADGREEDQTTKKWMEFTRRNDGCRYAAGNPFAFRTPSVSDLAKVDDPIGPENVRYLHEIIDWSDVLVPCWGDRSKLPKVLRPRLDALARMLFASGKPVRIFGLTKGGDPKHPLMLGYSTPLIDWTPA
jgi:hypothetical protein